jgi:hypothetical protein
MEITTDVHYEYNVQPDNERSCHQSEIATAENKWYMQKNLI